jgi:CDP-diacylglycerol--serine O-phosphatidyltransferase
LLTLGNGVCGFAALVCASRIGSAEAGVGMDPNFAWSGWLILAAMVFDALDGYAARLSRTCSKFGAELDSLCDAVSFGVAPAFLLLRLGPSYEPAPLLHQGLYAIAILYLVCVVLRLARFNIESSTETTSQKRFRGLPSPGAAAGLAALAILYGELPGKLAHYFPAADPDMLRQSVQRFVEFSAPVGALLVSLLMVSRLPYPHLTKNLIRSRHHFGHVVQLILMVIVIVMMRELAVVVFCWLYALGIPLRYLIGRALRPQKLPAPTLDEALPGQGPVR